MNLPQELFHKYMEQLNKFSDEEIIENFNHEVGNGGWGTARASYLGALHEQLNIRKFDYSEIGDNGRLSFANKVKLIGKTIKVIPNSRPIVLRGGLYKVKYSDKFKNGVKLIPLDNYIHPKGLEEFID